MLRRNFSHWPSNQKSKAGVEIIQPDSSAQSYRAYQMSKLDKEPTYKNTVVDFEITLYRVLENVDQSNVYSYANSFFKSILNKNHIGKEYNYDMNEKLIKYFSNCVIDAVGRRPKHCVSIAKLVALFYNFLSDENKVKLRECLDKNMKLQPIFRGFLSRFNVIDDNDGANILVYYSNDKISNNNALNCFNLPKERELKTKYVVNENNVFNLWTAILNDNTKYLASVDMSEKLVFGYDSTNTVNFSIYFACAYFGAENCFTNLNNMNTFVSSTSNFECKTIEDAAAAGGSVLILDTLKKKGYKFTEANMYFSIKYHHLDAFKWFVQTLNINIQDMFMKLLHIATETNAFNIVQYLCDNIENNDTDCQQRIVDEYYFYPTIIGIYKKQIRI